MSTAERRYSTAEAPPPADEGRNKKKKRERADKGCKLTFRAVVALFTFTLVVVTFVISFIPVTMASLRQADVCVLDKTASVTEVANMRVKKFFELVEAAPQAASMLFTSGAVDPYDRDSLLALAFMTIMSNQPAVSLTYYGFDTGKAYFVWPLNKTENTWEYCESNATQHFHCYQYDPVRLAPNMSALTNDWGPYDPRRRPWYRALYNEPTWAPLYLDWGSSYQVAATLGGPVTLPNGNTIGVMASDISITIISESMWLGLELGNGGGVLYEEGTTVLLSASFPMEINDNLVGADGLVKLNNYTRSKLINEEIVQVLGLAGLDSTTERAVTSSKGFGKRSFLRLIPQAFSGLNLRLVTVILEDDLFKDVRAAFIGGLVGSLVGMLVLAIVSMAVALIVFERPLRDVADRLEVAVDVAVESGTDALGDLQNDDSIIEELASIQNSFVQMTLEMGRLRSFLPDSLLYGVAEQGEKEDESVKASRAGRSKKDGGKSTVDEGKDGDVVSRASSRRKGGGRGGKSGAAPMSLLQVVSNRNLTNARITLLKLRLRDDGRGTNSRFGRPGALEKSLELVVNTVKQSAARTGGVIEHFLGDTFYISFNAVSHVTLHRQKAAECVLFVSHQVKGIVIAPDGTVTLSAAPLGTKAAPAVGVPVGEDAEMRERLSSAGRDKSSVGDKDRFPFPGGIAAGLDSGMALVGNVGGDQLVRHCVLGDLNERCNLLCARCEAVFPTEKNGDMDALPQALLSEEHEETISKGVSLMAVDVYDLRGEVARANTLLREEHADGDGKKTILLTPMRVVDLGNDGEWMYEMQRQERATEFASINGAFAAMRDGDKAKAKELLQKASDEKNAADTRAGRAALAALLAKA